MDNEERKRKDNVMDKIYPEYSSVDDAFEDGYNSCDKKWREIVQGWVEYYDTTASGYGVLDRVIIKTALRNILASLDGEDKPK